MRIGPPRRRILLTLAGAVLAAPLAVLVANLVVLLGGSDRVEVADAPHAQAALVLGAQVAPDGRLSTMLRDRLARAAELYHAGKVDKVLASGDHGTAGYDEVNAMKRALVAAGVPERDVFTDHAGFDTWDSVVRAREVFGVASALVVTQGFHLPRAVWLARRAGLEAHGVAADQHAYGASTNRRNAVREVLARVKAVADVVTGRDPRHLGPRIPITGDGRASAG